MGNIDLLCVPLWQAAGDSHCIWGKSDGIIYCARNVSRIQGDPGCIVSSFTRIYRFGSCPKGCLYRLPPFFKALSKIVCL